MRATAGTWLMTSLNPTPLMVSLVQVATTLPIMMLVLPAGALADIVDRRKVMNIAQVWMTIVVLLMGVLAFSNNLSAELLVVLIALQAAGAAIAAPAWDPMISEAVSKDELFQTIAVNTATGNIIRALGPAIAGIIVAYSQPAIVFFLNGIVYIVVTFILNRMKFEKKDPPLPLPPENVMSGVTAGLKYVRHSPILHALFMRTLTFVFPASSLWALLPLIARNFFKGGAATYGFLLACIGLGCGIGTMILPKFKRRLRVEQMIAWDSTAFGLAILAMIISKSFPIAVVSLVVMGTAWLLDISSITSGVQASIPTWVRARATAVNMLVTCASLGFGSLIWGLIASVFGISAAMLGSAGLLLLSAPLYLLFRLQWEQHSDLSQLQRQPNTEPKNIRVDQGPVLAIVEYRIDPDRQHEFLDAAERLRRLRLRDGAKQWGIFRDVTDPSRYIETFLVKSWIEHLRLHSRATVADIAVEEFVTSFHLSETEPFVNHFISGSAEKGKSPREFDQNPCDNN